MLELDELKRLHDKAYTNNKVTRERASDDLVFYHVTHWDATSLDESQLAYRGEFDMLKKAGRRIKQMLNANPTQVDFEPVDEERSDGADFLDGLYRADDRRNESVESYQNAEQEAVVCGVGAWELCTKYETNRAGDDNQVIRRKPIYEANNKLFWDPNAKLLDKSDADYVSELVSYSEDGYKSLVFELTGEEITGIDAGSFNTPQISYTFPWLGGQSAVIYVTRFHHREKVKDKVLTFEDPLGQPIILRESDLDDIMDDLLEDGYRIVNEKVIERYQVTLYIASGERILDSQVIAGEEIPVVPIYGERAYIEDEEHYEGITRIAKDPQRLRDFQLSYLADIVSRSPRNKPIFYPEQVQGYEYMYETSGADNNYPYLLMNRTTANGEPLPPGPPGELPEQKVPDSLIMSIGETRNAFNDVLSPGMPKDLADIDLSGKALRELNSMMDQETTLYQDHRKHAKRRDAVIYASMASVVYDAPRKVNITLPDGTRKSVEVMEATLDKDSGEMVVLNDLTNSAFDVFAEIGPSYSTKKEETREQLGEMANELAATDPAMSKSLRLQQLTLMDGIAMDDIRENARKELIISGHKKPETPEEEQLLMQSQQNQKPDAATLLAMAEMEKAKADQMKVQLDAQTAAAKAQNDNANTQINAYKAQTDRANAQVNAEKAGAEIDYKRADAMGKKIDNLTKTASFRAQINQRYEVAQ